MNPYNHGFSLETNFIPKELEDELVETMQSWIRTDAAVASGVGRSVIRFGYDYANPPRKISREVPWYLQKFFPTFDAVSVNIYETVRGGDDIGIDMHTDSLAFDDTIHIISLLGDCDMLFQSPEATNDAKARVLIPRRSLATLRGDVRKTWKHATEGRDRRMSIVFRKVRLTQA